MDKTPKGLAAQVATFHQELIDNGFSASLAGDLSMEYVRHLCNMAGLEVQHEMMHGTTNAAPDSESAPAPA